MHQKRKGVGGSPQMYSKYFLPYTSRPSFEAGQYLLKHLAMRSKGEAIDIFLIILFSIFVIFNTLS